MESQEYCRSLNSKAFLAEIQNEETQILLQTLAQDFPDVNWWLGGSDLFKVRK